MKRTKTLLLAGGLLALLLAPVSGVAQEAGAETKTKFYNFDDLLVEGQYKKPQVLYTDARQKVKFERLLRLKRDFLPSLKATAKDATLR